MKKIILTAALGCCALLFNNYTLAQTSSNCSVNAGGDAIVCGSTTTLSGASSDSASGGAVWTFISGPATPTITTPSNLTTTVTGMSTTGVYNFQLSQTCTDGTTVVSNVSITAHPRPANFTAGADINGICADSGSVQLSGVIPAGFTGEWRAVNIYAMERYGNEVTTNGTFDSPNQAQPVFSLIKKSDHDIDPAYYLILKITSLDGICTYEDTAIVRFTPNPTIIPVLDNDRCVPPGGTMHYFYLSGTSPQFSTGYPGVAGAAASGTTITLNPVSQPAGGAIAFDELDDQVVYLSGITVTGQYTFTLTVSNSCGSYTTPLISYHYAGNSPRALNFQPSGHGAPEQLALYAGANSAGEVHCGLIGSTATQNFFFSLHPDDTAALITDIANSGIVPPGGNPTPTLIGAGSTSRQVSVAAPAGGWQAGTYRFSIYVSNPDSSCSMTRAYYIHVADGARADVEVPDTSACYSGAGSVTATIRLPEVYKGVINSSYLQDFNGHYNITLISAPAGAATPTIPPANLRQLTATTTTISNLNVVGDYYFAITPSGYNSDVGPFLEEEYDCSGASMSDTFLVRLESKVNANAGSDQSLGFVTSTTLVGNSPGSAFGAWRLVSAPAGAAPVIADTTAATTTVTDLTLAGIYEFTWNISTPFGGCVSTDTIVVNTMGALAVTWRRFTVTRIGDAAILRWTTETEENNSGFVIQRSATGTDWEKISFLPSTASAGNSNHAIDYAYTDDRPLIGKNLYRLKQIDFDGRYSFSNIREVIFDSPTMIHVYPNPVDDHVTISGLPMSGTIYIYNILGKKVKDAPAHQQTETISLADLPAGAYMIQIQLDNGQRTSRSIIKLQ